MVQNLESKRAADDTHIRTHYHPMNLSILILAVSGMEMGLYFGLAGLAAAIFFGGFGMYIHHRRQALWHETARIALEKGQPLPPLQDLQTNTSWQTNSARNHSKNDFRSGLVLIAVGIGLFLFLSALAGRALGLIGAIPGLIGVALLLYATLNALFGRKHPSTERPPQS